MFNKFKFHNRVEKSESKSPTDERMLTSDNDSVRFILKHLGEDELNKISNFTEELKEQDFIENPDLKEYHQELYENITSEEKEELRNYTGFNYKGVNAIERNIWNYDELGEKTPEKVDRFKQISTSISGTIKKSPAISQNIKTFRGTNLDSFRNYDVEELEDLKKLEGQLYYEQSFASSSLSKETSFYNKEFDDTYRKPCNIEIEYLVPSKYNHDGIALVDDSSVSYSKNQKEYLFDKHGLYKIQDVEIGQSTAKITMALIPKELWANEDSRH